MDSGIELDEDIDLHKKGWSLQRIAWLIIAILILLFILGLFGSGPLSNKTIKKGRHQVKYEQYLRYENKNKITFSVSDISKEIQLEIPQEYLNYFLIKKITPSPKEVKVVKGQVQYTFSGSGDINICLYLKPEKTGSIESTIKLANQTFRISQFIYP